ncbi:serine/threonine-protein kinase pim-1-like [Boleophthalmus pectinirostris]|uniref:serine/threonine-protein kinase pim-1-like n=1 Tax=Boleophthalmus pectinirostris TaxID=150288 RepID=UPI00242DDFFB|nr:serine/threonine-protein kinase pim-1-like [Boleophthalmus pectinirostris]
MTIKTRPSGPAKRRKIRACRSCAAVNGLDQEKHQSPKFLKSKSRKRPETSSADSDPVPRPSGVSHVSQRSLGTEGHSGKRKREEEDETEKDSKKSRSKSPIRGPTEQPTLNSKYLTLQPLCNGGFGRIWSGVRRCDNLPVVIKYIDKVKVTFIEMEGDGISTRLPEEVYFLRRVGAGPDDDDSSVTPQVLDWYDLGPEVALVLEKPSPCMDLFDYLQDSLPAGVPVSETKIIFRHLVDAAIEMEAKGVFHRDIKPENILIETGGEMPRARYIDFGWAINFTPGQTFDEQYGTPQYLAPEWYRDRRYTSASVTAWQLGVVLFMMLFNMHLNINEDTIASMREVPFPKPLPEECRDLLRGCLALNPKKRLSLQEMRDHPWLKPN